MTKPSINGILIALLIGVVCALFTWFLHPVNNFLLNNSGIADSYLPSLGVLMIAILAIVINPLLSRFLPALKLSTRQLALIFGIILVACSSTAIVSTVVYALPHANKAIAEDKALSDIHQDMDLPESFYLDGIEYGEETPVSSAMVDILDEGESIPWKAWIKPALTWGSMIAASLFIMVGLSLIVYPQWRNNERLPFPLLSVQQALIETPDDGGRFPLVFRSRLFWGAVIAVFLIYLLKGLNLHSNGAFPNPGLSWGLWEVFHGMLGRLPWYVKAGHITFVIIGITYFVPSRISFSLWFTVIAYSIYRVVGYQYFAPFHGDAAQLDHRNGAVIGVALVILWLGRHQWVTVAKSMFTPAASAADRRNRTAGFIFCIGCLGLLVWQIWAGNSMIYALLAVVMVVITSLVLARMVAETGLPVFASTLEVGSILGMLPISWLSSRAIYLTSSVDLLLTSSTSKVSAVVTSMHGFGMDEDAGPRQHARLAKMFIVLLLAGILITGIVTIWLGYHNSAPMDGRHVIGYPNNNNIATLIHNPLKSFARDSWNNAAYSRVGNTLFGFVVAIALQIACLLSPLWPLHPAGMIVIHADFFYTIWPCIFLGWAIKRAVVMYGGAKAYRLARPLFLGMILGEVFSAILWAAVPAILIWLGGDAAEIGHLKI